MDDYITKPFEDALLLEVIGRYLRPARGSENAPLEKHGSEAVCVAPPSFSPKECLGRCAANLDLAKRLVGMLIEQGEREIPMIAERIATEDWKGVREIAHGLRGAAGNLGAAALHAALTAVEETAQKSPEGNQLRALLERASDELIRFRESDPLFALEQHSTTDGPLGPRSLG